MDQPGPAPPMPMPMPGVGRLDDDVAQVKARYQALVEQIPAVLYINLTDEDDTTVYVSPQTEEILGIPPAAWLDGTWGRHVHPDDDERVDQRYQEFVRHEQEGVDEYRFIRPDGREIWIHDRVAIIRDETGAAVLVQGVMFDVTEQHQAQALAEQQAQVMQRLDTISLTFTEILVSGADPEQVLASLADVVSNPVVLEDAAHQVLAYAQRSENLVALLAAWAEHSRLAHASADDVRGVSRSGDNTPTCAWTTVRLHGEEWGRLHVLELETPVDDVDRIALDRAAAAIGIALLTEREASRLADKARARLISDIWRGHWRSASEIVARARTLGAELADRRLAAVVLEVNESNRADGRVADERRELREAMLESLPTALQHTGLDGLSALVGDRLVGILALPGDADWRPVIDDLAARTLAYLEQHAPGVPVVLGVSTPADSDTIRTALVEASEAASYGLRVGRDSTVHHFDDLGLLQLLVQLSDGPELSRFVEGELGPVLDHDAEGRPSLLETLKAFLASGGQKSRAARSLHVERRTLYYRLERIATLLGRDLDDQATRLRLDVALQGLDLLRQRAAHRSESRW
ncbi:MAG TPA: helix-turn-helix domain-containing protein [Nocardioides sp.]|jgi:purine catabolism regulator|nr:helix-turn-helix domain-containing protein [Nocardioides sp.]